MERNKILEAIEAAKPGEKVILPDGSAYIVENGVVFQVEPDKKDAPAPPIG